MTQPKLPIIQLNGWKPLTEQSFQEMPEYIWGYDAGHEEATPYRRHSTANRLYFDTGDKFQDIRQDWHPEYWLPRQ